ncbi:hypothetical protein XENTR_v10002883 [Xenopus tropicalis]|uniref:Uncharacterized protein n=1 Tax=Xenopus tropicalis TaxID=8364 RepID=A0A6I8QNG1_XENTR|nr:hypothetical protein XENTR_v10002883 [Xenopus tropicalis]
MELVLHYRPYCRQEELQKIAEAALEEFPTRPLPTFVPWFPCHLKSFTLKPARCAPTLSKEDISRYVSSVGLEQYNPITSYDSTVGLLEFKPKSTNLRTGKEVINGQENHTNRHKLFPSGTDGVGKPTVRRSWSICTLKGTSQDQIAPISQDLKNKLEKMKLPLFHRGKWIIPPSVCSSSLENIWEKLNSLLRHHYFPNCNATMQRDICEIWVFCDLLYSEYTGQLLKTKLQLTGRIDLIVHKYGVLLSL